jgi:hypothetical protein
MVWSFVLFRCSSKEALFWRFSKGACLLGERESNDDPRATFGENRGGSASKGGLLFVLLKEFNNTSKDISPFSPDSPHLPFPFFFLVMTRGKRNTTHTRVLAGQSGGTSFTKHGTRDPVLLVSSKIRHASRQKTRQIRRKTEKR